MKAFRGEILSVPGDPAVEGPEAIRHFEDGLLVVEDGLVLACGPYSDLAGTFAETEPEPLDGLIVPGFVDAHVHYPQIERIASHGEQLMQWLERHIFPAEKAFADRGHADAVAAFFLDELLRHGTTNALVFATVHAGSVDALFEAALERDMRIVSGKVLMDLGPEGLRDTVASGRAETEALIARWRGHGRLGYAVTPRFAPTSSAEQLADAGRLVAEHPDVRMHTHLSENPGEIAFVAERFPEAADYLDVYDRFGLVGPRSIFAHCVHMSDRALARMAEAGSGIAFCPTSNMFLGSGLFDLALADRHRVQDRHRHRYRRRHDPFRAPHAGRGLPHLPAEGRQPRSLSSASSRHRGRRSGDRHRRSSRRPPSRPGGRFRRPRRARHGFARPPLRRCFASRPAVRPAGAGRRPRHRRHLFARPPRLWESDRA